MRDKSIRTEQDVTAALGLPTLVAIPWIATETDGKAKESRTAAGVRKEKETVGVS
jgi:hypothetical protein